MLFHRQTHTEREREGSLVFGGVAEKKEEIILYYLIERISPSLMSQSLSQSAPGTLITLLLPDV